MQHLYDILKGVSRSFYLSMRFLPARMRDPVSVAYLLARASDTLADVAGVSAGEKLEALRLFREKNASQLDKIVGDFVDQSENNWEAQLLRDLENVWVELQKLDKPFRDQVELVVDTITQGQIGDVSRFEINFLPMEDEYELLDYCYLVAGCVGEFWTEIGFLSDSKFSNQSKDVMRTMGRDFGCGLQLVNILRDAPRDLMLGRVYLPGMVKLSMAQAQPWIRKARCYSNQGLYYSDSLASRIQRMAAYLPAVISLDTLRMLENSNEREWERGVKVPRVRVYQELLSGVLRSQHK